MMKMKLLMKIRIIVMKIKQKMQPLIIVGTVAYQMLKVTKGDNLTVVKKGENQT